LVTSPIPTGSALPATIGIVRVAWLAGTAARSPIAEMTSTLRRTRSAASSGRRSAFSLRRSDLDDDVLPLDPAQLAEFLPEGNRPGIIRTVVGCEEADPVDLPHRLCVGSEQRTQETEDQGDRESAP
jgi:hypothetical protein